MKICILVERWVGGGIENYLTSHFEHMDMQGLDIIIVTSAKETDFFDERLNKLGIKIKELLNESAGPFVRPVVLFKKLNSYLEKESFDLIHINANNGVGLRYAKIAQKSNIPRIIVHSHNSGTGMGIGRSIKLLGHYIGKKLYMKYPTEYWACSDLAAKWLFSPTIAKNKYSFVKNGINTEKVIFNFEKRKKIRSELGLEKKFTIGSIGRLSEQKNHAYLLNVFSELVKVRPEVKLLLIGSGELEEKLKLQAKELSISDDVIFYGSTNDVQMMLSAMDTFVLPSKYEGFPLVGIEAQCSGLETIVSNLVTKKLKLTDLISFEPINSNNSNWINRLESIDYRKNREQYQEVILNKGYDIKKTASDLRKRYLN